MNQTPQRLPLSENHDGVARTVREQANLNRAAPNCGCQTSLSLTPLPWDQFAAEKPFRSHDPNSNMANIDGQRAPLPVTHNEPPGSPDPRDSLPESAQSHRWSRHLFPIWHLKVWHPRTPDAPSQIQSTLSLPLSPYFIIASIICLLAFLLYIIPSSSRDMSFFRNCL